MPFKKRRLSSTIHKICGGLFFKVVGSLVKHFVGCLYKLAHHFTFLISFGRKIATRDRLQFVQKVPSLFPAQLLSLSLDFGSCWPTTLFVLGLFRVPLLGLLGE